MAFCLTISLQEPPPSPAILTTLTQQSCVQYVCNQACIEADAEVVCTIFTVSFYAILYSQQGTKRAKKKIGADTHEKRSS